MSKTSKFATGILLAILTGIAIWLVSGNNSTQRKVLTFADGVSFWVAPTIYAKTGGFFKKERLDVDVVRYRTGLGAKNAVVSGSADIGIVANTPLAAGFGKDNLKIIATFFRSKEVLGLVSIKPNGETTHGILDDTIRNDWTGSRNRVAIIPGTISELLLDRLLEKLNVRRDQLKLIKTGPSEAAQALESNQVDYAVIWQPQILRLKKRVEEHGNNPRTLLFRPSGNEYEVLLHLVAKPETIIKKQELLTKFLKAVRKSSADLTSGKESVRIEVERVAGHSDGELKTVWDVSGIEGQGDLKFGLVKSDSARWSSLIPASILKEINWVRPGQSDVPNVQAVFDGLFDSTTLKNSEHQ